MILSAALLYCTLAACAALAAWLAVRYDLHEREPLPVLLAAAALGAFGMYVAGRLQVGSMQALYAAGHAMTNGQIAGLAGVSEEVAKFVVVAAVALCFRRHFNEPLDGLVYGSFAGLGAAMEESIAVLSSVPATAVLPMQEPVRLAGHLVMGGIGGFGVGLLVLRSRLAPVGIVASLLGAIVLHSLWDVVAFDAADVYRATGRVRPWHTVSAIGLMLGGMIVYRQMITAGARMVERKRDEG